ncbi:Severe Depolymerization of Actin [Coemansia javaensis]|uniref:Protein SDA1 n=1 Tax=Coemansia javaensis TaxID=2761396 RepID=A0A9W8HHF3_9FUNG|nr:Severe Depolymerization of Actin [Coemansia javaensis]
MGRRLRSANLLSNLPQLQNLIKRDPQSYVEEFGQQLQHFEASLAIFELKPDEEAKEFGELIVFLAQVARCYPKQSAQFPGQLIALTERHYAVLNAELRKTLVQALILLRGRGVVTNAQVMPLFFTLFRCRDKKLRKLLYTHIVNDVKAANRGRHRDHALNKALQGFMYTMIAAPDAQDKHGEGAVAAKKSLDVCIDLYRKNVWTDAKAVNVIVQACFSPVNKIMLTAVQFFLNPHSRPEGGDGDDDSDGDAGGKAAAAAKKAEPVNYRMIMHQSSVNKKTKHRKRKLEKATRAVARAQAKRNGHIPMEDGADEAAGAKAAKRKGGGGGAQVQFDALSLIHDPQGFAEKLFARVHRSATATKRGGGSNNSSASTVDRFGVRLLLLKLISRLIGHHQLQLMAFYPFLQRYLQPHQTDVTQILAVLANATHALTPPDVLQPLLRAIADNFVSDHCAPEVMCAGLNTIRAVSARQPLALDPDLLNDLVLYRKHKDKGVMMAARSLIMLYRQINPELLRTRDRGRDATLRLKEGAAGTTPLGFGELRPAEGVDGAELLGLASEDEGASERETDEGETDEEDSGSGSGSGSELEIESSSELEIESGSELEIESGSELDDGSGSDSEPSPDAKDDEAGSEPEPEPEPESGPQTKAAKKRIEMTRFLTNEDFARIEKLKKRQASSGTRVKTKRQKTRSGQADAGGDDAGDDMDVDVDVNDGGSAASGSESDSDGVVDDRDILGEYHSRRRVRKATYDERMQSIKAGREGREKYASSKARRDRESRSLTNKEKRKTKSFKMIAHKRSVVSKGRRSLAQKRRELRRHVTSQKRGNY